MRMQLHKHPKIKERVRKEIYKLNNELRSLASPWKRIVDVISIPSKYILYIQPMRNVDLNIIKNSVFLVEEYLGCRIVLLPPLPMPEDPLCYKKARGQYDAYAVQRRLKRILSVPNDAIGLVAVTGEDIYAKKYCFLYGAPYCGSYLISYRHWYHCDNVTMASMLAKSVCRFIMILAQLPSCYQPLCMCSSDGTADGINKKRFLMCPSCCEKFKKTSPEAVFSYFQRRFAFNHRY
jgi:predicted Zn-dependent protease